MSVDKIKELIQVMKENKIKHLNVSFDNENYEILFNDVIKENIKETKSVINLKDIDSPMIGIIYRAPAPKEKPYINVNDIVKKGQVLCTIEAMKTFNEIIAESDCEIIEICFNDEQLVEFGQTLFKVQILGE